MLDLTTLEKTGVFPDLEIHALKDKIGLHLVVLYIVIGLQRFLTLTMHLLAPDTSTFLIPSMHLTGGIASGLGALTGRVASRGHF